MLLQWVQVVGAVFLILCSCVSLVWPVLRRVIIIPSFLLLKFGVCWWKPWILLCSWVLLVVFHVLFHSFFCYFFQWIIGSSQGIGRWLRLLVSEGTVASFAALNRTIISINCQKYTQEWILCKCYAPHCI